jgi:hypothetical protein
MATPGPHRMQRLPKGAQPEALQDTIKTLRATFPRLVAAAEADGVNLETPGALPDTRATMPETDSATSGGGRAGLEAERARAETHFATAGTSCQDSDALVELRQIELSNHKALGPQRDIALQKPLTERLVTLFGKGDNPSLRMTLYMRIQLTCQNFGKEAELVLRDVIDAAKTKRNPGNYFAFSIVRRFRESGFFREG